MSHNIQPVKCGCGGEPYINRIAPYFHLIWESQVKCNKCHIQTAWYEDKDRDVSEVKAIYAWNEALNKDKYCYNCKCLEDQHYCLYYGLEVDLGMSCDNWEYIGDEES